MEPITRAISSILDGATAEEASDMLEKDRAFMRVREALAVWQLNPGSVTRKALTEAEDDYRTLIQRPGSGE